jgi:hypothetical protein
MVKGERAREDASERVPLKVEVGALAALVALALVLRGINLGWPPLWVDEAESCLNALTIIADGVPTDRHLGIPLYENTLVRPWPGSDEYEFRDVSYSDRGLAIYHGWLPLYAIAAALRLAGVTPLALRNGIPPGDASRADLVRWTAVPRVPALLFSCILVLACFGLGRRAHGLEAGLAMALAAGISNSMIWFGRQARYYSATLALNAVSGLAIWNACRRGRLRDYAVAGLAIGLLFHTHALSAVTVAVVLVAALPLARGQPRLWLRVAVAGGVAGVIIVPWALWSGLIGHMAYLPPARDYLSLRTVLSSWPNTDPVVLLNSGIGLVWFGTATLLGERIGERWRRPFLDHASAFYFALVWTVLAYAVFIGLVPAASYFVTRIKLAVAVPGLLLNTVVVAAASRSLLPRMPGAPIAGMAVLLALSRQMPPAVSQPEPDPSEHRVAWLVRSWALAPEARVYAEPNAHLTLTYYSGRPIQSISPVRKTWLDGFASDLVIINGPWYEALDPGEVRRIARAKGRELSLAAAVLRVEELRWLVPAIDLLPRVAEVRPPPHPLDDLDTALVAAVREKTRSVVSRFAAATPLANSPPQEEWRDFWQYFFYWFAQPLSRIGPGLNYAGRLRTARAHVLSSGWIVFDCRPHKDPPLVGSP